MRNLFIVLWFGLLITGQMMGQEKSTITVKSSEVNNGVVIVTGHQVATSQQAAASFALHCNKGMAGCQVVEAGTYLMVRLPKNWGMYDCANVDLYPTTADPESSQKIGEYCLIEK